MELDSRLSTLTGRPSAPTCFFVSASSPWSPTTFTASRADKERFIAAASSLCSALGVEDKRLAMVYAESGVSRVQDSRYDAVAGLGASIRVNRKLHGGAYVPHATEANLAWALIAQDRFFEADTLLAESLEECSPLQVAFKFYPYSSGRPRDHLPCCGQSRPGLAEIGLRLVTVIGQPESDKVKAYYTVVDGAVWLKVNLIRPGAVEWLLLVK